jgi:plastocyanin
MHHFSRLHATAAVLLLAALLTACGFDNTDDPNDSGTVVEDADVTVEMTTSNMSFEPDRITAEPGQVVAIVLSNPDSIKHDFVLDDIGGQSVHVEVQPRQEVTFTITMPDEPGEWRFYCSVPGPEALRMEGFIVSR